MSDILIVIGVLMVMFYVPVVIGGLIDRTRASWAIVASCVGTGILIAGIVTAPEGTSLRDIPGAFIRVLALVLN